MDDAELEVELREAFRSEPTPLPLSDAKLHVLLHALGVQRRGGAWRTGGWRNHYSAQEGDGGYGACTELEVGGWMRRYGSTSSDGPVWTFRVTEAGIVALRMAGWPLEDP